MLLLLPPTWGRWTYQGHSAQDVTGFVLSMHNPKEFLIHPLHNASMTQIIYVANQNDFEELH